MMLLTKLNRDYPQRLPQPISNGRIVNASIRLAVGAALLSLSILLPSAAQQPTPPAPEANQLLRRALSVLSANSITHDVTLSGTAHYTVGPDDETGTATLKAIVTGASRIDLMLPSGPRIEVRNLGANVPVGTWSGPDGVDHAIPYHNLLNEPSWFSPVASISRLLASPESAASFVSTETIDSQSVQHISVTQQAPQSVASAEPSFLPHLTQIDFYLDSATSLPAAITFDIHPDNDALIDIPIEVRFSDYRPVNGTQIPFHVQKFLNHGLILDLQFESATINSGLSATALAIQ